MRANRISPPPPLRTQPQGGGLEGGGGRREPAGGRPRPWRGGEGAADPGHLRRGAPGAATPAGAAGDRGEAEAAACAAAPPGPRTPRDQPSARGNRLQIRAPKQGRGCRFTPAGPPPAIPPWTNPAPVPASPAALEWRRSRKNAGCKNLGTIEAVFRRNAGIGEQRIKASVQAEKGAGAAEADKILMQSPPGTEGGLPPWRITISEVWQLQKCFQRFFIHPDNDQGRFRTTDRR